MPPSVTISETVARNIAIGRCWRAAAARLLSEDGRDLLLWPLRARAAGGGPAAHPRQLNDGAERHLGVLKAAALGALAAHDAGAVLVIAGLTFLAYRRWRSRAAPSRRTITSSEAGLEVAEFVAEDRDCAGHSVLLAVRDASAP